MELFQAHLGKRERRAPQDPKVTGALLDNEVLLGHLALEGRKETKETRATKSTLGEGGGVLPSSHKLSDQYSGAYVQVSPGAGTKSPSNTCFSLNKMYTYGKLRHTMKHSYTDWVGLWNSCKM